VTATLGLLAGQLVLAGVGYALLRGLGVASLNLADLELLGLGYLAGWASMGVLVSIGLMLGAGESLPLLLGVAVAATAMFLWLGRSAKPPPRVRAVQSRRPLALAAEWSSWVLIAIAAASAAVLSAKSGWNATRDFDAFNFWIPKAEVIYTSHGLDAGLWRLFPHPEYPPLAPASDAYTFFFAGLHPSLLPTQRTLLGISFLFSLFVLLGRLVPRWVLLPFLAALATATWFWGELGWVMVDLPVACLVAAAATTGFLWLAELHRAWLALTWIFVAAGCLTKFEGFFFAGLLAIVILAAALVGSGRRGLSAAWLLLAPACILVWRLWLGRHGLPTTNSNDYHLSDVLDPHFLSERTFRLTRALSAVRQQVGELAGDALGAHSAEIVGFVLVIPWVGVLVLAGRRARVLAVAAALWVVGALGGLVVVYWIGRPPINWYLAVTLNRVAPTVVLAGAALTTLMLGVGLAEDPSPAGAISPARPSGRLVAVVAAAAALAILLLADVRPAVGRSGKPSAAAIRRQLVTQFGQELRFGGYQYHLSASCDGTTPDGLSYLCLISTTKPEGSPPKILQWNVTVTCLPRATSGPRCVTDHGEALG